MNLMVDVVNGFDMKSPWIRRTAFALGALTLLLAVAAIVLVATFDADRAKSLATGWMKTEYQRTLVLDGPVELSVFPRLALKVSRLRLSEHGRDETFAAVDEAAFALQLLPLLRKELVIGRVSARGVQLNLLRDARGRRNIDDLLGDRGGAAGNAPTDKGAAPPALRVDVSAVQLDDLRLRITDELLPLAGELVLQSLTAGRLADKTETPIALRATARLNRPQTVDLTLDGKLTLRPDFERAAVALNDLKLAGTLDGGVFDIQGSAALGGKVPALKLQARFDQLDLNRLLATDSKAAPPVSTATAPADTPVPLDVLKGVDAEFKLSAGALTVRQYQLADIDVAATLAQGVLTVSRLAGRAWGGRFEGTASADADRHQLAVRLDASDVNVDALIKNVADKGLLEGKGHVVVDLHASGDTVGALRSRLAGTAAVQLRDGAIKGFNLARALRRAKAALALNSDAAGPGAVEKTDFSEMQASATIADGVAHSEDLDLKSPYLRIAGAGRFDIGRGRVDYTARATVTDSAAGQGGTGLEALRGVTVPVLLSGRFDAIDWKIQWAGIGSAALRNQVEDRLKDKLKGGLKGLFR